MTICVLLRDHPERAVALATDSHVLIFRHNPSTFSANDPRIPSASIHAQTTIQQQCIVEFSAIDSADLTDYRSLTSLSVQGTLGLVTINGDIFLCVVSGASRVASVRPGENVQQITSVDFRTCKHSKCVFFGSAF